MLNNYFVADVIQIAVNRFIASWPWYLVRGAGFMAAGLLVLLMLSGIGQVTGLTYKIVEPVKAWAIHRALGIALCVAIAIHILAIILDKYMTFGFKDILLPLTTRYTNGTTFFGLPSILAVTFGVLAMYGVIVVMIPALFWINTKKKTFKWTHFVSYFVMVAVFIHALWTGTDLKSGFFRGLWIGIGVILVAGIVHRLMRAGTTRPR